MMQIFAAGFCCALAVVSGIEGDLFGVALNVGLVLVNLTLWKALK